MTRVAIYARYSSDLQNVKSIEDQVRICKATAEKAGWTVVETYADEAISGEALITRPGMQRMLSDGRDQKFDIAMSEVLDRFSRDQENIAHIFKQFRYSDVSMFTLSENMVTEIHIGMNGTMNALFLKELARKTHRGLEGRALQGKSAGGKAYGYDIVRNIDERGAVTTGERKINDAEAAIVRRIFSDYNKGKSPKKIAFELNKEGVAGPTGRAWSSSTINGNRVRGTGIINNELYIGIQTWNRQRFVKNPDTGKRVAKLNPKEDWIVSEVPELRIVSQEAWDSAKAYQGELDRKPSLQTKQRPANLFSFLLKCGECGGGMSIVSQRRYRCSTSRNKGTCECRTTISQDVLEEKVLGALRGRLMDRELTKVFCEQYAKHLNAVRMETNASITRYQKELAKTEREIDKILDAVMNGFDAKLIADKANGLQRRKEELIALLDTTEEAPVYVHPRMGDRYAEAVDDLMASLNDPEHRPESAQILRQFITKIVLTPNSERTELIVDLCGDLAGILEMSESRMTGQARRTKEQLGTKERKELEQVEQIVASAEIVAEQGFAPSKDKLVAGAISHLDLPSSGLFFKSGCGSRI